MQDLKLLAVIKKNKKDHKRINAEHIIVMFFTFASLGSLDKIIWDPLSYTIA